MPGPKLDAIHIMTVPHDTQRYPTTGDWVFRRKLDDTFERLNVYVSDMDNEKFESLVGVHEVIEALLCRAAGIDEEDVSKFDTLYEDARFANANVPRNPLPQYNAAALQLARDFGCSCKITDESEPGDDFHAPYYKQHQLATSVERMMAAEMGVSWMEYEQANLDLYNPPTIAPEANVAPDMTGCANWRPQDEALEDAIDKLSTAIVGLSPQAHSVVADVLRRYADAIRNR